MLINAHILKNLPIVALATIFLSAVVVVGIKIPLWLSDAACVIIIN